MARIEDECGGDDWLVSKVISPEEQQRRIDEKLEEEFDILDEDGETLATNIEVVQTDLEKLNTSEEMTDTQDVDDEYADMEEFEDDDVMEDEAAVATTTANMPGKNIMKVR